MKSIRDLVLLFLYCFFALFQVHPDFKFVLAFLCAVIICCIDYFVDLDNYILPISLLILIVSLFYPAFLYFIPAVSYFIFWNKRFLFVVPAEMILFYTFYLKSADAYSFVLCTFGLLLAFVLQKNTHCLSTLDSLYRHTRDDSTERNILLAEKNHVLLENQNYEIYAATLRERNRIAREIHDNVGHLLSRSILMTGALQAVNRDESVSASLKLLDSTLNSAMDSIRNSVHDLHDDSINLEDTINSLIKDFTFCPIYFHFDMNRDIPKEIKYCFISITKEALANIMNHSNADRVQVSMLEHPGMYQLCIEDNGVAKKISGTGIGLINMKERVHSIKGHIQILKEKGYKIFITIPKEI
jgi:signal transduction histidine kinase